MAAAVQNFEMKISVTASNNNSNCKPLIHTDGSDIIRRISIHEGSERKKSESREWVVHPDHVSVPKSFGMFSRVASGSIKFERFYSVPSRECLRPDLNIYSRTRL